MKSQSVAYLPITARDWNGAAHWAQGKAAEGKFKEVRAYDSNNLEHWLLDAQAVGLWFGCWCLSEESAGHAQESVIPRSVAD
jgi:hypothetical protein